MLTQKTQSNNIVKYSIPHSGGSKEVRRNLSHETVRCGINIAVLDQVEVESPRYRHESLVVEIEATRVFSGRVVEPLVILEVCGCVSVVSGSEVLLFFELHGSSRCQLII